MRCESCGTYGNYDYKNQFVSSDWLRCQTLQSEIDRLRKELAAYEGAVEVETTVMDCARIGAIPQPTIHTVVPQLTVGQTVRVVVIK